MQNRRGRQHRGCQRRRRSQPLLALLLAFVAAPRAAVANGAFPSSGQILLDPNAPNRVWISTSYGFARRDDAGGDAFYLTCEAGIGYSGGFHPHAAITPTGALFMGVSDGLVVARDPFCAFARAPELEGSFVIDVSVDPEGRAIALVQPPNGGQPYVARSEDDLATWTKLGVDLPTKTAALTLDASPTDPSTVYVSATTIGASPLGEILTTHDAGQTWFAALVPGSDGQSAPFIGAVDATHPGRLFVRLNSAPGRLLQSDDHGATFSQIAETTGFLNAFRLSADGATAYFGGTIDGLSRLDVASGAIEPVSAIGARCLTLDGDTIYACADEAKEGFAAAISIDSGGSFTPLFRQSCILGLGACGAGTPVREACDPEWPAIQAQLAQTGSCDQGGAAAGGAGGGSAGSGAAPQGGAANAGGASAQGGGSGNGGPEGGCGCATSSSNESAASFGLCLLGLMLTARRRARSITRR